MFHIFYHFIIKESAEEFEKQFNCLGENTECIARSSSLFMGKKR